MGFLLLYSQCTIEVLAAAMFYSIVYVVMGLEPSHDPAAVARRIRAEYLEDFKD